MVHHVVVVVPVVLVLVVDLPFDFLRNTHKEREQTPRAMSKDSKDTETTTNPPRQGEK